MLKSMDNHMDLGYMESAKVISDHFPCHTESRATVDVSWHGHKWQLVWGFLVGGFEDHM